MHESNILLKLSKSWALLKNPATNTIIITKDGKVILEKIRYLTNKIISGEFCELKKTKIKQIEKIIQENKLVEKEFEKVLIEDAEFSIIVNYMDRTNEIINYYGLYKKIESRIDDIIYNSLNNLSIKDIMRKLYLLNYNEALVYDIENEYKTILPEDIKKIVSFNKNGIKLKEAEILSLDNIINEKNSDRYCKFNIFAIIKLNKDKDKIICYDITKKMLIEYDEKIKQIAKDKILLSDLK